MSKKMTNLFVVSLVLFVGAIVSPVNGDSIEEDKQALLDFLHNINHARPITWKTSNPLCKWIGVTCSSDHSRVIALRLPAMGLRGEIPQNTISRLTQLQILSLRFNEFSGPLPWNFSSWKNLSTLDLSNNGFNGSIPLSISELTQLRHLNLADNNLSGEIPDLDLPSLLQLDLANNHLTGLIPTSLQRFPGSAFIGNNLSIGHALPFQPPAAKPLTRKHIKLGEHAMLAIVLSVSLVLFGLISISMLVWYKKERKGEFLLKSQNHGAFNNRKDSDQNLNEEGNKIVFFEGRNLAFDLEDLLRASAEVLGKGTFGTSYKVILEDAAMVVVKRLKEVNVSKREFEHQMEILGKVMHENVAALRGYYYSKDEKLMVYDFHEQGSLHALLHGARGEGRNPLDWKARLKMAIGAARGIAHIHEALKLVHGNIKSSNVFLNSKGYGCVSDAALAQLMSPLPSQVIHSTGYRAPEVTDTRKATQASDVYSFGVLLFEILTGKSEVVHLVRWVDSVVREEWTGEVFDVELLKCPGIEEEMVEMLQVGMACTARKPEQRPEMMDVVKMVEEIKRNPSASEVKSECSSSSAPSPDANEAGSPSLRNKDFLF